MAEKVFCSVNASGTVMARTGSRSSSYWGHHEGFEVIVAQPTGNHKYQAVFPDGRVSPEFIKPFNGAGWRYVGQATQGEPPTPEAAKPKTMKEAKEKAAVQKKFTLAELLAMDDE